MAHTISFKHAWDGIVYALKSQPNFRIHLFFAVATSILSWWLAITPVEWLIVLFAIMLVIVAEMLNTAIESMTDLITTQHQKQAKIAKDVSAGMVLITASLAVIVGFTVFIPYIVVSPVN